MNDDITIEMDTLNVKKKINSGLMLFTAFLPAIGLFLENYANGFLAGLFLWIMIVIAMLATTIYDISILKKNGYDISGLKRFFWLCPLYIFKRQRLVGNDEFLAIGCGVFCIGAVLMNGFSQGIMITEKRVPSIIMNSYVSQLDNFSGESTLTIGEAVSNYSDNDVEWSCEKNATGFEITVNGKHDNEKFDITFQLDFDGFSYQQFKVAKIVIDGNALKNDDFKTKLSDIFMPDSKENSDSN